MSVNNTLAPTPPMGWNSYDCFGGEVTEAEVLANAEYLARHLRPYGWEYVVIDIAWHCRVHMDDFGADALDPYGRLLPDPVRFPSSRGGAGFALLADALHARGLKFGIHVMPGIPRRAVEAQCPVLSAAASAADIVDDTRANELWPQGMPFVDMTHPAGQAYYDSLLQLYAEWGVDFIKADGVGAKYYPDQVEALDLARQRCGRPIVLSLSAGCTDYSAYPEHRKAHCEMWRNSEDFWDRWTQLENQFYNCRYWQEHAGPGHWQDADMLPLGRIGARQVEVNGPDRMTHFTRHEQVTLMTLWCICQSPLMFGGDLTANDDWTLSLLTNPEVLAVNQQGRRGCELYRDCTMRGVFWRADMPDDAVALACFNFDGERTLAQTVPFAEASLPERCRVRDLWAREDIGVAASAITTETPPHGARSCR